ncbi:Glucooligosaccharide oxidase [Hypoxylon sp. EC38]|nr:Glucooligosaccharide oxidase [Hypoxylon sp. EC38]
MYTETNQTVDLRAILTDENIKWSPQTEITFPGDEDFENATVRWTIFKPPTYQAAVSPGTEADIITAVHLARDHNIPFLATGGRHGYGTTLGNIENGLALDLGKLNSVLVDKDAGTLTVGPGAHFSEIFDPVFNAGYSMPTGSCSCVGVIGAVIGAGVGRLSGLYGLTLDQLISARVVTADGQIVTVSDDSNTDLFWGIRGAGANLGILTSATFKLSPLINGGYFASFDMIFPAEKNESYFDVLASFDDGSSALPAKLAAASAISYNSTSGKPQILANWVYAGTQDEAESVISPVLNLDPSYLKASMIPWNRLSADAAFGLDAPLCVKNKIYDLYGINLRKLDKTIFTSVFERFGDFYATFPDGRSTTVTIEAFPNQGTLAIPNDATAYPWRDTKYNILLQFTWEGSNNTVQEASTQLAVDVRGDLAINSGYSNLTVYVNYAHGDETIEQIYGADKLPRLAKLKKAWDPDNVFAFNNPLPTLYA